MPGWGGLSPQPIPGGSPGAGRHPRSPARWGRLPPAQARARAQLVPAPRTCCRAAGTVPRKPPFPPSSRLRARAGCPVPGTRFLPLLSRRPPPLCHKHGNYRLRRHRPGRRRGKGVIHPASPRLLCQNSAVPLPAAPGTLRLGIAGRRRLSAPGCSAAGTSGGLHQPRCCSPDRRSPPCPTRTSRSPVAAGPGSGPPAAAECPGQPCNRPGQAGPRGPHTGARGTPRSAPASTSRGSRGPAGLGRTRRTPQR